MKRRIALAGTCLAVLFAAEASQAENWFSTKWNGFCAAVKRNNAWPEPFIPADRYAARAPFAVCVANGWRVQNTLTDYHFNDDTGTLNEAGELKLKTIVTQTPLAYRTVFVLRADDAAETASRIASVQQTLARQCTETDVPVVDTNVAPRGSPAYYIVDVDRSFRDSAPAPRLPAAQGGSPTSTSMSGT